MAENVTFPKVVLKKKQVQTVIDFCLDESIEFSVKQQAFPGTDFEVELKIKDMKLAVLLGMFLRENKLEMDGIEPNRYKKSSPAAASPAPKKAEEKAEKEPKAEKHQEEPAAEAPGLSFM